jgi:hypothetical protein
MQRIQTKYQQWNTQNGANRINTVHEETEILLPKEPLIGHFKHGPDWLLKYTAVLCEVRVTHRRGVIAVAAIVIFKPLQWVS